MSVYLHPGVYIEEIPGGSRPIESVSTSTALFIGFTSRGPMSEPTRLTKWDDYQRRFAGPNPDWTGTAAFMNLALQAFFLNGGGAAYIVRLANDAVKATATNDNPAAGDAILEVEALHEGTWAHELRVRVVESGQQHTLLVERWTGAGSPDTANTKNWEELERFTGPSSATDPRHFSQLVKLGSQLIAVTSFTAGTLSDALTETGVTFVDGEDGDAPDQAAYQAAFTTLERNREISIVCLPGQSWDDDGKPIIEVAISHAEKVKSRVVLVDPPVGSELTSGTAVDDLALSTSTYAALYYPWVEVANPAYDAERNPGAARTTAVGPSAFAAGMYAKIDGRRGVWKAPAGVETGLLGVAKLKYPVDDAEQDVLNPAGVNCLRALPGYGSVIWGARTLSTKANPEWRYVPVRRTAIMLEQSIYNSIQWAVFEPNDEPLWSALRASIGSFMNGLFRAGAFQGGTANDAYFVRCGLGDTMTQGDIDLGQVIVMVGFAPLKPAEFVIVRIQQKVAKQ
jgi:phage tail sheath protein FI